MSRFLDLPITQLLERPMKFLKLFSRVIQIIQTENLNFRFFVGAFLYDVVNESMSCKPCFSVAVTRASWSLSESFGAITPHTNRQDIWAVLGQLSFSLDVATSQRFVNGAFSG